ncbi:MAG: DUF819 family protein [Clostridia bacterium]|nr:DUF819 family protein [Clostridia bacterium]
MDIVVAVIQGIAVLGVPALVMRWRKNRLTRLIGTVGTAYLLGIAVAAAVWLVNLCGVDFSLNSDIGEIGSYVAIGLAIPLLLFGTNLKEVRRLSKPVLISFGCLIFAVCAVCLVSGLVFGRAVPEGKRLAAMAVGLYTGGTPNFNAIGVIIGAENSAIVSGNLADMLIGGVFYVFILLLARPLLSLILPKSKLATYVRSEGEAVNADEVNTLRFSKGLLTNGLLALGCLLVGGAIGAVLWLALGGKLTDMLVPAIMITVTVLGIVFSFSKKVRSVKENVAAGQYLILVFSFALSSSLRITDLDRNFLGIFALMSGITVVSFIVHAALCAIFRIDTDCAIITMTAGIYGPAFVPAVTSQLKNDKLTAPGLICGALGYAVGTFLGVLLYLVF